MTLATEMVDTVKGWGCMAVSIAKTQVMVVGTDVDESDVGPLRMENGSIEIYSGYLSLSWK